MSFIFAGRRIDQVSRDTKLISGWHFYCQVQIPILLQLQNHKMPPKALQKLKDVQDKQQNPTQQKNKGNKKQKVASSSSDGQPEKERVYNQWTAEESSTLVEWFEVSENYDRWKFSGKANKSTGRLNTTATTRAGVEREIQQYLASKGIVRNITSVEGKIKSLENSWKKAHHELVSQTGTGTDDLDERLRAPSVKGKL